MKKQKKTNLRRQRQREQQQQRRVRAAGRAAQSPSQQTAFAAWQSRRLPAAELATLESVDGFSGLRNTLRGIAAGMGEWAGIPMPLDGLPLVIEPNYPHADVLSKIGKPIEEPPDETEIAMPPVIRNRFWSYYRRQHVIVFDAPETGKVDWGVQGSPNHTSQLLSTLGAADAWGIEQEGNAVRTLGTLLRHRPFKQYILTGMFLESSKRSGVTYLFRRLRPTLAISTRTAKSRILCALCLHPIAYYSGSWAGAMTPTDDVIAHLMFMRGDEHGFWKKANQHPPYDPNAGVQA